MNLDKNICRQCTKKNFSDADYDDVEQLCNICKKNSQKIVNQESFITDFRVHYKILEKLAKWILYFNFGLSALWLIMLIILGAMALYDNTFAKEFFHNMFDVSQYHTKDLRRAHFGSIFILAFAKPILWIMLFYDYKIKKGIDEDIYQPIGPLVILAYMLDIKEQLQNHDVLSTTLDVLFISMLIYILYAIKKGYLNLSN